VKQHLLSTEYVHNKFIFSVKLILLTSNSGLQDVQHCEFKTVNCKL